MINSHSSLLKAFMKCKKVHIESIGDDIFINQLTVLHADKIGETTDENAFETIIETIADLVAKDDKGNRLFKSTEQVKELPIEAINLIFEAIMNSSSFGNSSEQSAKKK